MSPNNFISQILKVQVYGAEGCCHFFNSRTATSSKRNPKDVSVHSILKKVAWIEDIQCTNKFPEDSADKEIHNHGIKSAKVRNMQKTAEKWIWIL